MIHHEVAFRYAKALFNLATDRNQLQPWLEDLQQIAGLLNHLPEFRHFLFTPQIGKKEKETVLQRSLNGKIDSQLLSFLLLLLDKGRLHYLPEICRQYHRMVEEHFGILNAKLITAIPVSDKMKEQLKAKLEKTYHHKNIEIKEELNPEIMGGMILLIANHMMDYSIQNQLAKLKENLLSVDV